MPQAHTYTFTDENVARYAAPLVYYRLRQVDLDGTFSYSPLRTVALTRAGAGLALYPNPATQAATLTGAAPGMVVMVLDALGRPVATATAARPARPRWPYRPDCRRACTWCAPGATPCAWQWSK